jgi:hypothetical protein
MPGLFPIRIAGLLAIFLLPLTGCTPRLIERDLVLTDVVAREQWGARPPLEGMQPHRITHITIHHMAVMQDTVRTLAEKLQALQNFSQSEAQLADGRTKRAWADSPYHYYIDYAGRIAEMRPVGFAGDTNTAYDPSGHALVVLEGNFEVEQPTPSQIASLMRMTTALARRFNVPSERVGSHLEYTATLCPGSNLQRLMPQLRAIVAEMQ